jgi:uncharacterized protein YbjT (DUF2867 family)
MEASHAGQTYMLTWEDACTAADLAALLSRVLGREIKVFDGDAEAFREALIAKGARSGGYPPAMARYFAKVAAGLNPTIDTAAKVLGRPPQLRRLAR